MEAGGLIPARFAMELFEAIRVNAMGAVVNGGGDYTVRHILRWYSKTFHTPLHVVEELPLDHVLTHYYEETYEAMEKPERDGEIEKLSMTAEEYEAKQRAAQEEEEAYVRMAEEEAAAQQAKAKPKMEDVVVPNKPPLIPAPVEQNEISMKFVDDLDLDKDSV